MRAKTRNNYAQWFVFFDNVGINVEMLEELRRTFSAGHWFRGGLYLGLIVGHGLQTETDMFGSMPQSKGASSL